MHIGIITEEPNNEEVAVALKNAGESLGHEISVLNMNHFAIVNADVPKILYENKPFEGFDVCLIRGSENRIDFRIHLVKFLNKLGIKTLNSADAILACNDKFTTQAILNSIGLKTPKSISITKIEQIESAVAELNHAYPMVIKTQSGSHGVGVIKVDSLESLKSILQYLLDSKTNIMIQEFFKHSESGRIMVLGDKVIAAVMRTIPENDFRSNLDQGAELKPHTPSELEISAALKASEILQCDLCALDYILVDDQMVIFEVNSSPGLKGIQSVNPNIDIALEIMRYVADYGNEIEDEEQNRLPDQIADLAPNPDDNNPVASQTSGDNLDGLSSDSAPNPESAVGDASMTGMFQSEDEAEDTIGLIEPIIVKRINNDKPFDGKIDTGADRCSLHGENIEVGEDFVRFSLNDIRYRVPLERQITAVQSNGREKRPIIKFDVEFNGKTYQNIEFNISDRSSLKYQVLIGKNLLELTDALIDPHTN